MTINISAGNFSVGNFVVTGFFGGQLIIKGVNGETIFNVNGSRFDFRKSQSLHAADIIFDGNGTKTGIVYAIDAKTRFNNCSFRNLEYGVYAFQGSELSCYSCVFDNNRQAVRCSYASSATIESCSGSGNDVVYYAANTIINATAQSPSGTTMIVEANGGKVFRGQYEEGTYIFRRKISLRKSRNGNGFYYAI